MKVVCGIKVGNMKDPDETKRGKVGIVDFAVKPVGPEEVKIKVAYCSICGSDRGRRVWSGAAVRPGA